MGMNQKKLSRKQILLFLVGLVALIYLITHATTKPKDVTVPLPKVKVQKPVTREIVDYVTQTGTTVALNSVNLVARVAGYLEAIDFTDGTMVNKGSELFVIQPEPYWEQLKEAQATVAANKAQYEYSKLEYERQKVMYKTNATSLNNVQKWFASMEVAKANLDKSIAEEVNSEITYSYTHIKAPFKGRIGRHMVDIGNLVGNGTATVLATLEQIDTLYVYFNLNELDLIKLRSAARAIGFKPSDIKKIPVYVNFQNESGLTHQATLDFVNTGLNASTGTMELRALLDNKDILFVPGLFVKVQIAVSPKQKQLTVPSTSVLYDQLGAYLLTVDTHHRVQQKYVELGAAENGNQAIVKGLMADDEVVIDGLQFATPGNLVQIQGQEQAAG